MNTRPLTFRRHPQAPLRGSSPRSQLTARAVTGRSAFTYEPRPPSARPVRSAHSNDPKRLPSYRRSHAFTYEPNPLRRPVKDAVRDPHTVSPSLVPSRASTPTTTSLGLGTRPLGCVSRCVRPTSANHSASRPCTRALGSRPCLVHLAGSFALRRKTACGAIGGSVVSRRAGPASAGRGVTRTGIRRRVRRSGVLRISHVVSCRSRLRL